MKMKIIPWSVNSGSLVDSKVNIIALKTMSQELTMMIMIGEDFGLVSKQPYLVTLPYTQRQILV